MRTLLVLVMLGLSLSVSAQIAVDQEPLVFESQQEQDRFNQLTEELRCLVCQNQNLADSDAPLAHDLRDQIFVMMQSGNTDAEIKSFLIERYGDFVLYKPPFQGNTLLLWLLPLFLLLGGIIVVIQSIRKRSAMLSADGPGED